MKKDDHIIAYVMSGLKRYHDDIGAQKRYEIGRIVYQLATGEKVPLQTPKPDELVGIRKEIAEAEDMLELMRIQTQLMAEIADRLWEWKYPTDIGRWKKGD